MKAREIAGSMVQYLIDSLDWYDREKLIFELGFEPDEGVFIEDVRDSLADISKFLNTWMEEV